MNGSTEGETAIKLGVHYTPEDVRDVRVSTLVLWRYDGTTWQEERSEVDRVESVVWADIDGLSTVGVFGEEGGPPPLPGFESAPQDPDGDERYEDVNDDGEFTVGDVQWLFLDFLAQR